MAKSLKITVYTKKDFKCTVKNIIGLLRNAGMSPEDKDGNFHVFGSGCEWEVKKFSEDRLSAVDKGGNLFRAFGPDDQVLKISVQDQGSFSVWPSSGAKKSDCGEEHFDFNWYYDNMIHAFNKDETVVEKVIFEQY